jgi:hypothetical protein
MSCFDISLASWMSAELSSRKMELAARDFANIDEYVAGKNDVLLKILQRAGWSAEDLEEVRKANTI